MKFRFCGELDCPDWILAEINTLSRMVSQQPSSKIWAKWWEKNYRWNKYNSKIRQLLRNWLESESSSQSNFETISDSINKVSSVKMKLLCQHVAKSLLGEEIDFEKVKKLTSDAKFEIADMKASVAALSFIFNSSARHAVEEDVLSGELQQLGLPKEHTSCVVKVHSDNLTTMMEKLKSESLRLSKVEDVQWRVGFVSESSHQGILADTALPEAIIKLKVWDVVTGAYHTHEFTASLPQLRLLVHELKTASNLIHTKLSIE